MHLSTNRLPAAILALVLLLPVPPAPAQSETSLSCRACLALDDTGAALYERRARARLPNASTTKMVTALVVVAEAVRDETVTVSARAAATPGAGLALEEGDRYTVEDLLRALLLTSANDAAVALAEHVAGSEPAFVQKMNRLAAELGLHDTRFANPHGLDAPGHHSSARDLATIGAAVLRRPVLARIVASPREVIPGPQGAVVLENRNPLLEGYRGAIGIKTGYTARAGEVLVAAARRSGRQVIVVSMGSTSAVGDSRRLLDLAFDTLAKGILLERNVPVAALVFDPSGAVEVVAERSLQGIDRPDRISLTFAARRNLRAPIERGEVVGVVTVVGPRGPVGTVNAVAAAPVPATQGPAIEEVIGGMLRLLHRAARLLGLG